jgi:metal-responsive CopG/Arc/MetJ family transcriptional regulator
MTAVEERVRTHIVLPRDVIEAVDRVAGRRKRSEFIAAAVRDSLIRAQQREALENTAGALAGSDYPEWETPEKTSAWVRKLREEDNRSLERKLRRWSRS